MNGLSCRVTGTLTDNAHVGASVWCDLSCAWWRLLGGRSVQEAMEEVRMPKLLLFSMLCHARDNTDRRERAEQAGLQNERLFGIVDAQVEEGVVPAVQGFMRLLHS